MALKKFFQTHVIEAGCDEAGRGCLAGPVFAAAVILNPAKSIRGLNDSKKLNETTRLKLRDEILDKALAFGVASCTASEIDKINILKASHLAMHRAIDKLSINPSLLLIDGNRFTPYKNIKFECIIKGDGKYQSIAASSILAKTFRDEYMNKHHNDFPYYNWQKNKGYPTEEHRKAIALHGACELHRKSFTLLNKQTTLF